MAETRAWLDGGGVRAWVAQWGYAIERGRAWLAGLAGPRVEVEQGPGEWMIRAELGESARQRNVTVVVRRGVLEVRECGRVVHGVELPREAQPDEARARFEEGLLVVRVPVGAGSPEVVPVAVER